MHNNSSPKSTKIAVIIVAAGRGRRAGLGLPKQYRDLNGQMVLSRTLACFAGYAPIIIVIHPDDIELYEQACAGFDAETQYVFGGNTRTASVKAGLEALRSHTPDIVLIHDAARPFLQKQTIEHVLNGLEDYQAVVPALPMIDAVKSLDGNPIAREYLRRVQTPQGFHFTTIRQAYVTIDENADFCDDIEVARQAGLSIGFCTGDSKNIKLTWEEDFIMSTSFISISGSGYDVHRICPGKFLTLCGVEIQAGFSLRGHSDADVGLHALTDALLGTIAAGDIGDHFPPSDMKWKGENSTVFLNHAAKLIADKGGIIDHVDITLICEQPKVKPHRDAMRAKIAEILNISLDRVSVKATTTEGLGFTGRAEGIAAQAMASVRVPS